MAQSRECGHQTRLAFKTDKLRQNCLKNVVADSVSLNSDDIGDSLEEFSPELSKPRCSSGFFMSGIYKLMNSCAWSLAIAGAISFSTVTLAQTNLPQTMPGQVMPAPNLPTPVAPKPPGSYPTPINNQIIDSVTQAQRDTTREHIKTQTPPVTSGTEKK